jgi:hypothetical protein
VAKKKKLITNKKERTILSDALPYELPATFSNRYFFEFLVENKINLDNNKVRWKEDDEALRIIIKLLFDLNSTSFILNETNSEIEINPRVLNKALKTIPFGYKISHKNIDFRELTVIHPKNQLALVEFYDEFKDLILHYCNISSFSIRRPHKIAKFTYHKDKTHFEDFAYDHEHKTVEVYYKEYENLKTFFAYKEISNIYKFYESYKYHRCEKKYDYLYKFDISKCFDSIYSHSISWALLDKDQVKDNILASQKTFGGQFDRFMQNLNYGETNGIVIGPEFSRIFAELILQQIDKKVRTRLKNQSNSWLYRRDYEIFRYVDDFFVFYNDDTCRDDIITTYRLQLKAFKLYINTDKIDLFEKPIITGITRAKLRLTDLFNNYLSFKVKEIETEEQRTEKQYSFYVSSNRIITRFKTIIKESGIAYKNIQNYTLACIDRKVYKLIKTYGKIEDKALYEKKVRNAFLEILDFTFFIYSISPKVNSTIKLCMILSKVTKFAKVNRNFNLDNQHQIFKKIYDEIFLVLKKYKSSDHTQVETLYLLIALKELGREYRIDEELLCKHYGIDLKQRKCENHLNYFSIVVLLFYIENKRRYATTKSIIKSHVLQKFETISAENRGKTTELTLLLFDLLVCPFLDRPFKYKMFELFGLGGRANRDLRTNIIKKREYWFTKWTDFDFCKVLEAKKSQEVY